MKLILLDYDLQNQFERIIGLFSTREDCKVCSLRDGIPRDFPGDTPVKGVVLTALRSGWMKYHSEIAERYPFVTHWIFCVVGMAGEALKNATAGQFRGIADGDVYCELIFDDENLSALAKKLDEPTKTHKKCLIVSLNADLAAEVKSVLQGYIPDWEIGLSTDLKPDYALCDSVFVVGNSAKDMAVAKPEVRSIRIAFWMNEPYFKNRTDIAVDRVMLGKQMNEIGWNIGDYTSLTFFSSMHHERVYQQICHDEMTPAALLSDPTFVLWDDCGLPLVQSGLSNQDLLSFLEAHTVFQKMAGNFCKNKKGEKER